MKSFHLLLRVGEFQRRGAVASRLLSGISYASSLTDRHGHGQTVHWQTQGASPFNSPIQHRSSRQVVTCSMYFFSQIDYAPHTKETYGERGRPRATFQTSMQTNLSPRPLGFHFLTLLANLALLSILSTGCSATGSERPDGVDGLGGASGNHGPTTTETGKCKDNGAEQECLVNVQQANGVKSCYQGIQFCVEDKWTVCLPPDTENPV